MKKLGLLACEREVCFRPVDYILTAGVEDTKARLGGEFPVVVHALEVMIEELLPILDVFRFI